MRSVAILLHAADGPREDCEYILETVGRRWRERGIDVSVLRGIESAPDVDLLAPQIDLSVIPPEYQAFIDRYPRVLNGAARDIRKSTFSTLRVQPGDGWDGPVIVKTDRNYGGQPERRLLEPDAAPWERPRGWALWRDRIARRIRHPLATAARLDPYRYPVYDRPADVPRAVFRNPELIVERFLPERAGELYCLRNYLFLGDAGIAYRRFSANPVVKAAETGEREELPVPPELREARRRMGFDYGKFDYVEHDRQPVLIDANTTPTWVGAALTPQQEAYTDVLASGWDGLAAALDR